MKMKHVMAALLFGVVALSTAQAEEEKHYRYYPYSMEAYNTGILASKDLNEGCRIGVDNYAKENPGQNGVMTYGYGKYKGPWTDYIRNGVPHRQIMCSEKTRGILLRPDGSQYWTEWKSGADSVRAGISCFDGGSFLWPDKNLCAEEVDKKYVVVCDPSFHEDGKVPEGCPPPPPPKNPCDPSNYPNGIVPEDCTKTEPKIKEVVNDPMCEKITRTQNGAGAVVCDDKENFHPCIWTDHLNIQPKAAEDVIRFCFNTHEKRHIETRNRFKTNCGPTDDTDPDFGIFPNTLRGKKPSYYLDEADAYIKTVDCLVDNIAYCKNDPICVKRIRDEVLVMRNKVFKSLRDYNEYCSKPENNCEQVILQIKSNLKNEKE